MRRPITRLGAAVIALLAGVALAHACSTPVFRVALLDKRWRPEPYECCLFHRGLLADGDKAILKGFNDYLDANDGHVNCVLHVVDLDKNPDKEFVDLFKKQGAVALPYLVVRHPEVQDITPNLWAGPLHEAPLRALLESPARAELSKRILSGESAVWVLVESGDQAKDDAAFALLTAQVQRLEKTLKLPAPKDGEDDKYNRPGAPPLKLAFTTMRLARTDPAERWLVEMLLLTEEDLKASKEPIVFPVLGRGIALYALMGKGINEQTLAKAAGFVIGECSCEVRRDNPGKDLLIAAPWETGQPLPAVANLLFMPPDRVAAPKAISAESIPAGDAPKAIEGCHCVGESAWYERLDSTALAAGGLGGGLLIVLGFGAYFFTRGKGSL